MSPCGSVQGILTTYGSSTHIEDPTMLTLPFIVLLHVPIISIIAGQGLTLDQINTNCRVGFKNKLDLGKPHHLADTCLHEHFEINQGQSCVVASDSQGQKRFFQCTKKCCCKYIPRDGWWVGGVAGGGGFWTALFSPCL